MGPKRGPKDGEKDYDEPGPSDAQVIQATHRKGGLSMIYVEFSQSLLSAKSQV